VLPGNPLYVGGFGSEHPGGANFAFGDGSVRFISQTIAQNVFSNVANRRDGQLPSDF
jgi:prepilin-type processing-associated H-X9-DG protein